MQSSTQIIVRFSDCDPIGHTNNAAYFTFFEQARVSFVRDLFQLDETKTMSWQDFPFIIAEISCRFIKPSYPDQVLIVVASTGEVKNSSFFIDYEITDKKNGTLIATGTSALVWYDYTQNKSVKIPEEFRSRLLAK